MIVKNEEEVLERCLSSIAAIVDEIIIIDTGSTDRTKEIASLFTDKVYDFEWIDDFSAARNFSFSKASMQYCMWLDADDVIKAKDLAVLKELKNTLDPKTEFVFAKYNIAFDAADNPTFSYYRERIIKRGIGAVWLEPVHECIATFGDNVLYSDFAVTHSKLKPSPPGRNLKIFEKHLKNGMVFSPRLQYYYARELMHNDKPAKAVKIFNKFLDDNNGWLENNIGACKDLASCYNKLGKKDLALQSLFRSFSYDMPRADISCRIASVFLEKNKLNESKFWYECALSVKQNGISLGFVEPDYSSFIPLIQLCVIHDRLGNLSEAYNYNEQAGKFKPLNPSYLGNKEYFKKRLKIN